MYNTIHQITAFSWQCMPSWIDFDYFRLRYICPRWQWV